MRFASLVVPLVLLPLACSSSTGDSPPGDAGPADTGGGCTADGLVSQLQVAPTRLYIPVGGTATVALHLHRDRCTAADFPVASDRADVATGSATVHVDPGHAQATFTVTGRAAGTATLTIGSGTSMATLPVTVLAPEVPACPAATAPATGMLGPGATVRGAAGTPLAAASVSLPAALTETAPLPVTLECAPDQVPDGYQAIGPAVRSSPGLARFAREVPITIPVNPALVQAGYELQVEVSYAGPAFRAPRVVPVANAHFTEDGRALTFLAPRLGTYQAVIQRGLGTRRYNRRLTYHAILGASMGAAGASMIGTRHPERFDAVVALGGPTDWGYLVNYIERYHVGGFCTAAQRAMDPTGCAMGSSVERTPPTTELLEHRQHFEHWYYPDGSQGEGGTFDRESYSNIFRDLTRMFGNAIVAPGTTGIAPRGVPDSELTRADADRCATPVVLESYFDDEYNPDGALPVLTFCDGTDTRGDIGRWDGGRGTKPMEMALAVDVNRNGRRDAGEPVLRNFREPYRDVGADGLPSAMEPGYDATTNPDPAGDDYDRQYNPGGTEGNLAREAAEPFDDVGLDGMRCPAGRTCPHDVGEGNGTYDETPGLRRFREVNARDLIARAPAETLRRLEFWADGGVRDLFNFGPVTNHFVGALAQRGRAVHYYNNFAALGGERVPETSFPYDAIDWARAPGSVMVRYGALDPTPAQLIEGDGGHVGTIPQISTRIFSSLWWLQARWPGGDRRIAVFSSQADNAGRCANGYFCTFDYRSPRAGRNGPVSIYLPPGYHDPANADVRYPVVYFLHGYGQQPQDLVASGIIIGNFMSGGTLPEWRRPQKYIMVFPDGRCRREDGCIRGTFYTDSPLGNARMETYFLDLYDFVDQTFRTRRPETVEVTE